MRISEFAKYWAYRLPVARSFMAPRYDYKVCPGQLAAMVGFIESSRDRGGAIVEVGVARGQTSMFILEHLRSTGDDRPLYLVDTFAGFTADSISVEVADRGKRRDAFERFRYTSERRLTDDLTRAGYSNFNVIAGDAALIDWQAIGPIGAMLLDVDLYQPTAAVLSAVPQLLVAGGGIVVDDCVTGTDDDGANQAYREYIDARSLPFQRVGRKGGVIHHASLTRKTPEAWYVSPTATPAAAAVGSSAAAT